MQNQRLGAKIDNVVFSILRLFARSIYHFQLSKITASFFLAVAVLTNLVCAADYEEDFCVAPGLFKVNHGSSIVELPDHSLLCCWCAGSEECAPDVKIYSSRFEPAIKTWTAPAVVANGGERVEGRWLRTKTFGNCALFLD